MKYVVCVPDGCADEPIAELGHRTPLEAADMPVLASLAARGEVGRAAVIPEGMPPGSDVGNMSIIGYDPCRYHTGRAPIEAAALGVDIADDQVAFRANLVMVGEDGTMVDFAGGHPTSEAAAEVIRALERELAGRTFGGGAISFHPGVQYRHVMLAPADWADAECVPPHDLSDDPVIGPKGPGADAIAEIMEASRDVLASFDGVAANQVWLWGQGRRPALEPFEQRYGRRAALVTAVDLVRGLGVLTGMDLIDVPGATGWFDTDYAAKRDGCLASLANGADVGIIHVEATDEAGHAGDAGEKVRALENWDALILADLVRSLDDLGPWRLLLLPDHATPVALKTHTPATVPYLLVDSAQEGPGGLYTEGATTDCAAVAAHGLMARLLA
ncbi:MAG: 2,3-bisphosphoglycerate-independent phosphoglycerate mutase [Actinomycetota bacterium]|nr:2,3-bisphosphoglycerate-independent phosphoglycerate mutase [Actinomycetota bacterium]